MRVRWLEDARLEALESARFYRSRSAGLGSTFTAEIRERIAYAVRFPQASTRITRTKDFDVRRLLFERFEYAVVFALLGDELVIVAVHHQHRKPGYWRPRLAKVRG